MENSKLSWDQTVIIATQETEIRIAIPGQARQNVHRTPSQWKKAGHDGTCLSSQLLWKGKIGGLQSRLA
jgi:hypothetical protein